MRGDLNDQFQRAQTAMDDDNSQKIIIGVAAFMAFAFIAMVVAGIVFFVKTVDKFVEAEPETHINREIVTQMDRLNDQLFNGGTGSSLSGEDQSTSTFQYGSVDGTSYYSELSGISFRAPSDWNFTSYAEKIAPTSPKDLTASSGNMASSVIIQYENMKMYGYKSIDDAIASVTKIAQGQNNQIVDKSAKTKWGGNKFEGIIYKKEFVSGYPTYYEVVCTQIGDYCLKITLSASSDSDLSVLRSYFN